MQFEPQGSLTFHHIGTSEAVSQGDEALCVQKQLTFASGMVGGIVMRFFNLCIKQLMSFDPDLKQQQLRLDLQVLIIRTCMPSGSLLCCRSTLAASVHVIKRHISNGSISKTPHPTHQLCGWHDDGGNKPSSTGTIWAA